jgi:hypothetical protein
MTTLFRCTRCGRIVTVDLEKSDGTVPKCREITVEYHGITDHDLRMEVCGGRLEPASKGEKDVPK